MPKCCSPSPEGAAGPVGLRAAALAACVAIAAVPRPVVAQISLGAQVTPLVTRSNVPGDSSLTGLSVTAPLLFGEARAGRVLVHAMLDLEGWTMPGGQLSDGAWGEGYFDRRHPHTLFHELMGSVMDPVGIRGIHWSLAAGKGFAPFGSDDPMNRPAFLYPVNHHWAQVLERAVAIAGFSRGVATLEAGLFNGDEPVSYDSWPSWERFGDSWSARALLRPGATIELQGSFAHVKSPENRDGTGPVNEKVSLSARLDRRLGPAALYALAEWTSNDESGRSFHSALFEAEIRHGGHSHYLRVETADRPEDQRTAGDPFRSLRPPTDSSLVGVTRWITTTAGSAFGLPRPVRGLRLDAIVELAWAHVTSVTGTFDPSTFYGRRDLFTASVGLRLGGGMPMHRMGRYGVAAAAMPASVSMPDMPGMPRPTER